MPELRLAAYLDAERQRILDTLIDWLRIPSISSLPEHHGDVRRSAERTAELLTEAGLEHVEVIDPPNNGLPAVYGDWLHAGPDAPTALVYGHHDVQPVDPLDLWTSPPFEPSIVDGELRARGAVDDKGQTFYEIEAARGLLRTRRRAAGQPEVPRRGRGGGRQPELRRAPRGPPRAVRLRRRGRLGHDDVGAGRAVVLRRDAGARRLRRERSGRRTATSTAVPSGAPCPIRRTSSPSSWPSSTPPTVGSRSRASTTTSAR